MSEIEQVRPAQRIMIQFQQDEISARRDGTNRSARLASWLAGRTRKNGADEHGDQTLGRHQTAIP